MIWLQRKYVIFFLHFPSLMQTHIVVDSAIGKMLSFIMWWILNNTYNIKRGSFCKLNGESIKSAISQIRKMKKGKKMEHCQIILYRYVKNVLFLTCMHRIAHFIETYVLHHYRISQFFFSFHPFLLSFHSLYYSNTYYDKVFYVEK